MNVILRSLLEEGTKGTRELVEGRREIDEDEGKLNDSADTEKILTWPLLPHTRVCRLAIAPGESIHIYKTYNKTCVTSKDSDQPVRPPSIAKVLVHLSLASPEAVEGTCDQQRL